MSSVSSVKIPNSDRFKQLTVWLLLPIFILSLCFFSILVIFPFYLYRKFVSLIAKVFDPKITRVLSGLSGSLLRDFDSQSTKPLSTIVVCLKCHGPLTFEEFREQFKHNILLRKRRIIAKNGTPALKFPELQQHYKTFMGYVFLRWDDNFDLNNHVKPLNSAVDKPLRSNRDLLHVRQNLMVQPFKQGQSPWEALFLDNFEDEESCERNIKGGTSKKFVVFIRIHHGLSDGFSIQKMLCSLDPSYTFEEEGSKPTRQLHSTTLSNLLFGPYQMLTQLIQYKESYHALHLPALHQSKEYFVVESPLILVKDVKQIKNHFRVGFTTILLAVVGGGIRKFLKRNQIPFPELQSLGIPFATGKMHADTLGNDFLIAPLNLPIHDTQPRDRIMKIQRQLENLHCSLVPKMLGWSIDMLTCLPINVMRSLTRKSVFSTAYSTLPGPDKCIRVMNSQLDEIGFTYGTGSASLGLCFSSITYKEKFRITIFVERKLMGNDWNKAEEVISYVMEEYKALCEMTGVCGN